MCLPQARWLLTGMAACPSARPGAGAAGADAAATAMRRAAAMPGALLLPMAVQQMRPGEGGGDAGGNVLAATVGADGPAAERPSSSSPKPPRTVEVARSSGVDAKGKRVWTVKDQQQGGTNTGNGTGEAGPPAPVPAAVEGAAAQKGEAATA